MTETIIRELSRIIRQRAGYFTWRVEGFMRLAILCSLLLLSAAQAAAQVSVNVFNEPGAGSVNSYWLASPSGIVVIDAQRTPVAAEKLVEQIKVTGKPVLAIIISHPHPDHARGLAVLSRAFPNAPIYSSQATRDSLSADAFHYFPDHVPMPARIIRPDQDLVIGNLTFKPDEIGAGEAEAMTVLYMPSENIVFSSDAVSGPRMTPFLIEGRSGAWLKQLETMLPRYGKAKTLYPGHGASGAPQDLISAQMKYLTTFRGLIKERLGNGGLSPQDRQSIVSEMQRRYPDYLPVAVAPKMIETDRQLIELNAGAIAKELAKE
jgi:glyoxylase-like metal-dependent hydrolase (beta-lactamase superfamily II)